MQVAPDELCQLASWDQSGICLALSDVSFLSGVLDVCGYARSSPVQYDGCRCALW